MIYNIKDNFWLYIAYAGFCILDIYLALSISYFQTLIESNLLNYGLFTFINYLLYIPKDILLHMIASNITLKFYKEEYEKYILLDQISKESETIESVRSKISKYVGVNYNNICWGFQIIMSIITTVLSLIYILNKYGYFYLVFIFIIINVLWYKYITINLLDKNDESNKQNNEHLEKYNVLLNLNYIRLQNLECDYSKIEVLQQKHSKISRENKYKWDITCSIQQLPTYFILMSLSFIITDTKLYPIILLVCRNIIGMLSSVSSFLNHSRIGYREYTEISEFWKSKTFNPVITQQNIPEQINLDITIPDLIEDTQLTIKQGDKIRINGVSGSGKTTLIRSILGYSNSSSIKYSDPSNDNLIDPLSFSEQIVYMKQSVREETPVNKLTLRELFYDELFDYKIINMLKLVKLETWFEKIMESNLDKNIDNKISGGEKTRLCMALSMYKVQIKFPKWLILDEPEQGLDMELVPDIILDIINYNPEMTVFIITHLCDCTVSKLRINKIWKIDNKKVNETIL
jgi:ABC-type transport system involved in cytochrome bd biosynthesis fused ATPase/permease subunit